MRRRPTPADSEPEMPEHLRVFVLNEWVEPGVPQHMADTINGRRPTADDIAQARYMRARLRQSRARRAWRAQFTNHRTETHQ